MSGRIKCDIMELVVRHSVVNTDGYIFGQEITLLSGNGIPLFSDEFCL
jgi:hypothetical protein